MEERKEMEPKEVIKAAESPDLKGIDDGTKEDKL